MKTFIKFLDKFEEYILIILMIVMTIAVVLQVTTRTFMNVSLAWTEEVARFILVWVTFVGASLGVKRGAHIGVEAFTRILPENLQKIIKYAMMIVCMLFAFAVGIISLEIIGQQIRTGQVSSAVQIPMWIPYLGVTVGMILMGIRFGEHIIKGLKGREEISNG